MKKIIIAVLLLVIVWAVSKWVIYKLSFMAMLLYYAEKGMEIPSANVIQEYQMKVARKMLGVRGE